MLRGLANSSRGWLVRMPKVEVFLRKKWKFHRFRFVSITHGCGTLGFSEHPDTEYEGSGSRIKAQSSKSYKHVAINLRLRKIHLQDQWPTQQHINLCNQRQRYHESYACLPIPSNPGSGIMVDRTSHSPVHRALEVIVIIHRGSVLRSAELRSAVLRSTVLRMPVRDLRDARVRPLLAVDPARSVLVGWGHLAIALFDDGVAQQVGLAQFGIGLLRTGAAEKVEDDERAEDDHRAANGDCDDGAGGEHGSCRSGSRVRRRGSGHWGSCGRAWRGRRGWIWGGRDDGFLGSQNCIFNDGARRGAGERRIAVVVVELGAVLSALVCAVGGVSWGRLEVKLRSRTMP
jgi:hypothetical protein